MSDLLGKSPAKKSKPNYWYSIISVSLVLFLLGFFGLLLLQTQQLINVFKERVNVLIELEQGTDSLTTESLLSTLKSVDYSKKETIRYITKEKALLSLQSDFGEDFMALDLPNPLYDVVTFNMHAEFMSSDLLSQIKTNFKTRPYVNDVYYQEGLVHIIADNVRKMGWFALGFGALFLIVAVTLIHNTIRLALYSNRFLIKNMELVGASWGFISRPYIQKSVWHGILSAFLAILALIFVIWLAQKEFIELKELQNIPQSMVLFAGLFLLGILINGASTWYVINKYLKMRLDDLY
ncbi:MAG: permease-like cell division protein FtsX [Bacteroidota bacterium]